MTYIHQLAIRCDAVTLGGMMKKIENTRRVFIRDEVLRCHLINKFDVHHVRRHDTHTNNLFFGFRPVGRPERVDSALEFQRTTGVKTISPRGQSG